MKIIVTCLFLVVCLKATSQNKDTLRVQSVIISYSDYYAHDTVIFSIKNDTLIITENKWKNLPSKQIAVRSFQNDILKISITDTGKFRLAMQCRMLTTVKIPFAFQDKNDFNLIFENKRFQINRLITSVSHLENLSKSLTVYPNPCKNTLYIKSDTQYHTFEIHNSSGEKVSLTSNTSSSLETENLKPGTYYLSLFTSEGIVTKAFQKY